MRPTAAPSIALLCVAALLPSLAACGGGDRPKHHGDRHGGYSISADDGSIEVRGNDLLIHADKAGTAAIHPDASLSIDEVAVPVAEADRKRLNAYRQAYKDVAETAIGIGVDGARLGLDTLGSVLKGLSEDGPDGADRAGREADRRGKALDARAAVLCDRLAALRAAQQALAAAVPKFAAYAVISSDEVRDCHEGHDTGDTADSAAAAAEPDPAASTPPNPPLPPTPPTPPTPPKSGHGFSFNVSDAGNWTLRNNTVVIRPEGSHDDDRDRDAVVSKDGHLRIGERDVETSERGRAALARYWQAAAKVNELGAGLGLAGADLALGMVGSALRETFGGDDAAAAASRSRDRQIDAMKLRVDRYCAGLRGLRGAQEDSIAAVADFKPFAAVSEKAVRDCGQSHDTPRTDDKANGTVDKPTT